MCDKFVLLSKVQFEKNGYQNRYFLQLSKKWVSMPVNHGLEAIYKKKYVNGFDLIDINNRAILLFRDILGIKTELVDDIVTNSGGTQRLIDNLNHYGATTYITHSSAKDKYLDEGAIRSAGIGVEYSTHTNEKLNILEMLESFGIEGTRKQLWKPKIKKEITA